MNKNKKRGILLIGTVVVFVVLILSIILLGKKESLDKNVENIGSDISEKDAVTQVAEADETISEGTVMVEDVLTAGETYEDVYEQLVTYYKGMYSDEMFSNSDYDFLGSSEMDPSEEYYDYAMDSWISFTEVQEHKEVGDVCKTLEDCAYLIRNDSSLRIMQLNGSSMEHKSLIADCQHEWEIPMEMYIRGDKLVFITCYTEILDENTGAYKDGTLIYTYDITNREAPVLAGTSEVEGFYLGSYMTDTAVYVYTTCNKSGFTDENNQLIPFEQLELSEYIPSVNGTVLTAENVYMAKKVTESNYLVCASVNMDAPDQIRDAKAFLSVDTQCYLGEKGIYVFYKNGLYDVKNTVLVRIDMTDGAILPTAGYIVDGTISGTTVMYEKDDRYYVIASKNTDGKNQNDLYMLDGQMQLLEKKEDITDSAEIQAVRYIGKKAFLTTNGEKPITVIDMEDSVSVCTQDQPDYFADMVYEFGENQILSLSYNVDSETGECSSIQLAMFDISDPSNISKLHDVVIEAESTPAVGDINGLYLNQAQGLIGFPTEDWDDGFENVENYYHVFAYSAESGFQNVLKTRLGAGTCWRARGFAMGNSFYVAENDTGTIRSYDMTNGYEQTGEMYY